MRRINVHGFYEIAAALQPLRQQYSASVRIGAVFSRVMTAHFSFGRFMESWGPHLGTSRAAAERVLEALKELDKVSNVREGESFEQMLDREFEAWELGQLTTQINRFEAVFAEEFAAANTYHLDEKGIYNIARMVADASFAIPLSIRSEMPETALEDFRESGKCLAFDLFTACGFHALRAFESVVVAYHHRLTGNKLAEKQRNWGAYVKALAEAGAPSELHGMVTHIKDNHRNPLMHPEEFLDESEATTLFDFCKSAIVAFVRATSALPPPPLAPPPAPAREKATAG